MELRTLCFFVAVVEEESFTRAAARLQVAQSAVSHRIGLLEHELGERLFERNSHGVRLTEAGRVLLPLANNAVASVQALKSEFESRQARLTGPLLLGAVEGVEYAPLPALIGAFRYAHPSVTVRLIGGQSSALIDLVSQGTLDTAVVALPPKPLPPGLQSTALREEEIVAVVPVDSSFASRKSIPLDILVGKPLITYGPDSSARSWIERAFRNSGADLVVSYATNDVALHTALVGSGVGISLSARDHCALTHGQGLSVLPLQPPVNYPKAIVWRNAPAPSPVLTAFLEFLNQDVLHGFASDTAGSGQ
ncbi:LysR family transcriptional regulator [Actinacidiphila guanduensis]|uniref:Transcriptional regulator, LysR family n=1 Tax=Actinacidiphila guanduensis TaxID=310781 RepID=A0A1H0S331_9ACTN|nr:LysR family transcriptional regulator [Actinacidiphila guanduensis]SDP36251.1 transcriptional regulator, LysR family [Actinacidiphila guanduensis]